MVVRIVMRRWALVRMLVRLGIACSICLAGGVRLEGKLPSKSSYVVFAGKFAFQVGHNDHETIGRIDLVADRHTRYDENEGDMYFMVFDDEAQHWKEVRRHWDSSTCDEKKKLANTVVRIDFNQSSELFVHGLNVHQRLRPRYWYFAFVACGVNPHREVSYEVHLLNVAEGWQQEISIDRLGLYDFYKVAFLVFGVCAVATRLRVRQVSEQLDFPMKEHPFIQLLTFAYMASSASCCFFVLHYHLLVQDGFGSYRIRFLGIFAGLVANSAIFLIAILASTGWGITTPKLPKARVFLWLVAAVGALNAMCELHADAYLDESTRLYSYQSTSGTISIILKVFMFCWFGHQVKRTYEQEIQPQLRAFYYYFGIGISMWAVNVPVVVVMAFEFDATHRYKVVALTELIFRLLGQMLLSVLFCGPLTPISESNTFNTGRTAMQAYIEA